MKKVLTVLCLLFSQIGYAQSFDQSTLTGRKYHCSFEINNISHSAEGYIVSSDDYELDLSYEDALEGLKTLTKFKKDALTHVSELKAKALQEDFRFLVLLGDNNFYYKAYIKQLGPEDHPRRQFRVYGVVEQDGNTSEVTKAHTLNCTRNVRFY